MRFSHHIPNALSLSRIPLGLALIIVYDPLSFIHYQVGIVIIVLAVATDVLDGKIARHFGVTSLQGYMLDGLGDKAFYVAFFMVILRSEPGLGPLCWILIVREIALYALRVVQPKLENTLHNLRWISLAHAVFVRGWFLLILIEHGAAFYDHDVASLSLIGLVLGICAAVIGLYGLALQARHIFAKP